MTWILCFFQRKKKKVNLEKIQEVMEMLVIAKIFETISVSLAASSEELTNIKSKYGIK